MGAVFADRWMNPEDIEFLFGILMNAGCFCVVTLPFTLLLSLWVIRRRNQRIMEANPEPRDPV